MDHDALVAAFGQTVGVEKAEALIADAAADLGIGPTDSYSEHEVADVCETIQRSSEGHVRLVASEVRVRQQAQRRFDALLEEITDPVVTVSFDSAEPVVTALNPAFEATFGYGSEAVGDPLADLIVPREPGDGDPSEGASDAHQAAIDRWLHADPDGGFEVECVTAAGERRTVLFRPVVVTRENASIEGYGIYTDITERKRRERRLEHQNEQLERFASVVAHDLRNPLQIARGRLEVARAKNENDAVGENLDSALEAYERMEGLIRDLLTLARQGQVVEDQESVTLEAVGREAWASVEAPDAALEVEDGARALMADRSRLVQLFENLLGNAVQHGDGDGASDGANAADDPAVTVRVGTLGNGFYVADDGPGIPPDERERVFDHGYSTETEGTGFGLAIVEAIAEAHEWEVGVREGRDGGARFEVTGVTMV